MRKGYDKEVLILFLCKEFNTTRYRYMEISIICDNFIRNKSEDTKRFIIIKFSNFQIRVYSLCNAIFECIL